MFKNTAFYVRPVKVPQNGDTPATTQATLKDVEAIVLQFVKDVMRYLIGVIIAYKSVDALAKILVHIVKTYVK